MVRVITWREEGTPGDSPLGEDELRLAEVGVFAEEPPPDLGRAGCRCLWLPGRTTRWDADERR